MRSQSPGDTIMAVQIQTTLGHAVPPAPRHAITVHMPKWQTVLDFIESRPALMKSIVSMYPRMMLHKDVKEVSRSSQFCFVL